MSHDTLLKILDLARWAPSGDNTQPWRFEIVNDHLVRVHGSDTRDRILYDFEGHASHMAHGALLETLRIAASGFGRASSFHISSRDGDRNPIYEVTLLPQSSLPKDELFTSIEVRTVQRRLMQFRSLSDQQRQALTRAAGNDFRIDFFENRDDRWAMAQMLFQSANIRLTCREAYAVHKDAIEWRARFSKDRIPGEAVGVDLVTARVIEWVMQSWGRVEFFNRYLLGSLVPRIKLDFLPAIFCAAHILIRPLHKPDNLADWVQLGSAMQRVWLTATHLGLHMQPEMTPVIFRWYARTQRRFSAQPDLFEKAVTLAERFEYVTFSSRSAPFGFLGRVGKCDRPTSRSTRLDLDDLMMWPT